LPLVNIYQGAQLYVIIVSLQLYLEVR